MRAYVINLKTRPDRWDSVLDQASALGIPIIRIEAIQKNGLNELDVFVASGVAATWKSHQLAMEVFLESGDDYGLILEDDFLVTRKWTFKAIKDAEDLEADFFQFGYLITSALDWVDLFLKNFFDCMLKMLNVICRYSQTLNGKFGQRLLVSEQAGIPWRVLPNNIRAGGQAYLVSRKFAEASKFMNTPAFTSADGMFMALGDVRTFRMYRSRKSLIGQTESKTSVEQRYL
jgi:GR25 family glycosyltransferase involved in LPS biosynthesis